MKKYLILVLIVLLIGALIIGVPAAKEGKVPHGRVAKAENVVLEYFDYASAQNWESAQSCCLIDSVAYLDTVMTQAELESGLGSYIWEWIIGITDVSAKGKYAEVHFDFTLTITVAGDEFLSIGWDNAILYLEKVKGSWKIYDSENLDYYLPDN